MIYLLNGPNLNMLGARQVDIYGTTTLEEVEQVCTKIAREHGLTMIYKQSNHEGTLIDLVQEAFLKAKGLMINPAGLSHTSVALADAIAMLSIPVIEVHISNIYARESVRRHSIISSVATATIAGFGAKGYALALKGLIQILER